MSNTKIAVVLIRGMVGIHPDVKKTLDLLRLKKKHVCAVIDDNEISRGMLHRVKDYVTFGTITEKDFIELLNKRGELLGKEKVSESKEFDVKKVAKEFFEGEIRVRDLELKYNLKPFFRLHPPIGGFERKGIKMPFTKGGVLGDRKESVWTLISKML